MLGPLLALARPVEAQRGDGGSETAAARELFSSGLAAARDNRWEEAYDRFTRSYALAPRASTLLNLAGAQVQTGRLVAASESYRRFLDEATDARSRRYRPQVERALTELEPRLAHLTLRITGLVDGDRVTVGETELPPAALGEELPVDPGERAIVVTRGEEEVLRESVDLGEGERQTLTLAIRVRLAVNPEGPSGLEVDEGALRADGGSGGDDTGLIVGVVVGVGAALAIAAVIVAVVLVDGSQQPYMGNLGDGVLRY